jgi:hypothetical protein
MGKNICIELMRIAFVADETLGLLCQRHHQITQSSLNDFSFAQCSPRAAVFATGQCSYDFIGAIKATL